MTLTILLIPGLMNDAAVWRDQIGPLSRFGAIHVARNDDAATLAAMADAALAATTGRLAVIGHSMGGRVALEMVAQAPQRIDRLALLDTGAHGPSDEEMAERRALVELAAGAGMDAVAERWLPPMLGQAADASMRAAIVAMLRRASPEILARQQKALIHRHDRSALLPSITCPTLVATGAEDLWSTPAQHAAMAAAIPGARLAIVPGAGHMLPVEAPAALTALLLDLMTA